MIRVAGVLLLLAPAAEAQDARKFPPKIDTIVGKKEEAVQAHLDAYFAADAPAARDKAYADATSAGYEEPKSVLEAIQAFAGKTPLGTPVRIEIPWLNAEGRSYFYLALPADYTPKKAWPVTFSLHGGDGTPDAIMSHHNRPEKRYGMITIFPITTDARHFWSLAPEVSNLLKILVAVSGQYRIDPRRVFCYGGSMGGMGTWSLLSLYPELFAAGASSAGYPGAQGEGLRRMAKVPLYALHGTNDHIPIGPVRDAISALQKAGGKPVLVEHDGNHFPTPQQFDALVKWVSEQGPQVNSASPFFAKRRKDTPILAVKK